MCGRYALTATPEEVAALFGYPDAEDFPPRYNIAPTQPIAVVRLERRFRRFALMRWGLVPGFVKEPRPSPVLFNARSESAAERPAFRAALRYRRCLIPACGFYEWRRGASQSQPFWVRPVERGVIAFAGIWETWMGADGSEIDTAAILTTSANVALSAIHDRMPVVIPPGDFDRWLSTAATLPGAVDDLLRPAPDDFFEAIPVDDRVNAAWNDDPSLQLRRPPVQGLLL